jgi:ribosome-associated toxin RatA of RatAB toxin-antitoxin module
MTLHAIPGGGQRRACRPIVFLFVAMLSMALAQHPRAATADDLSAQLSVREENGVYTVAARFPVDGPAERAVSVLTDYERIPQFMPGVKTSIVRERQDGRIVIEQEAVARFMVFSKRVHLLLEVQQHGAIIRFRDLYGESFTRYEGTWHVTEEEGRTVVAYDLTAAPSFKVPGALLSRVLKRDSTEMIKQLRLEIARSICRADRRS